MTILAAGVIAGGIAVTAMTAGAAPVVASAAGTAMASNAALAAGAAGAGTAAAEAGAIAAAATATTAVGVGATTASTVATGAAVGAATATTAEAVGVAAAMGTTSGIASTASSVGLAGAVGGPLGIIGFCFDRQTRVVTKNGRVYVTELQEGDQVQTICLKSGRERWTNVTNVTILTGKFSAHKMTLNNGHNITVTSPHYMLAKEGRELVVKPARMMRAGDVMPTRKGSSEVVSVTDLTISKKVNVETADGTILADGIFTTGICEYGPRMSKPVRASNFLEDYRRTHSRIH